ncbi:hypothetical protein [Jiangella rhizosphaerae]|uniref:hypothetical protein n=1 Tax=Jiangella rhizosphaerae TaxID=2293569 RepID=UPI0018F3680A|nr:hypothetical protein [Jiangella rhizosphaerae]
MIGKRSGAHSAARTRRIRAARRWMGIDITFDDDGRVLIADTDAEHDGAFEDYDRTIAMEARGHVLSNGWTWNQRWLNTFRNIRSSSENPEPRIDYIVVRRREAGLPDLVDGDSEVHWRPAGAGPDERRLAGAARRRRRRARRARGRRL